MTDRIRILFVDDEPRVLEGLVRLFRPQRLAWEVFTAGSGSQALDLLDRQAMDVVVSDMRMPSMDGVELLAAVHARHPAVVRIILSGQAEHEASLRRFGPCHHYLSKPCDPVRMVAAVNRSCALRDWLADPALPEWTRRIGEISTLPLVYRQMVDELRQPEPSLQRLADIVNQDVTLSSHLLSVINSSMFGLGGSVSCVTEAIAMAGVEVVRALVLASHIYNAWDPDNASGLNVDDLWNHGLATARLARAIMQVEGCPADVCEAAFTAGLLHDCGQYLLASGEPDSYAGVLQRVGADTHLSTEEVVGLGISHERLGAWLLHHWELPDMVVEAVAWHHEPILAGPDGLTPLAAVHFADALTRNVPPSAHVPDAALIDRLDMGSRLDGWKRMAEQVQS